MKITLLALACLILPSCNNLTPAQIAQANAIGNLALTYAESKGKITAEDAALVREAGKIVLTPTTTVEVSGK